MPELLLEPGRSIVGPAGTTLYTVGSIKQSLSVEIKIPKLPYNLEIRDVKTSQQGLTVSATAANVPLSGGRAGS